MSEDYSEKTSLQENEGQSDQYNTTNKEEGINQDYPNASSRNVEEGSKKTSAEDVSKPITSDPSASTDDDAEPLKNSTDNDGEAERVDYSPPGENAGEEAWNSYYRKLGAPADPSSYATPKDVELKNEDPLRRAAYAAGLSQRQYASFVREAHAAVAETSAQGLERLDFEMEAMKRRLGPRYPKMMQQYERGRQAFDLKTQSAFRELNMTNHPGFVEGLATLGASLMEDAAHSGTGFQGVNPYDRRTRNLTDQARLERDAPETARRLAAAAGVDLSTLPNVR